MSAPVTPMPTGTQFATAFDGRLEPKRVSILYRLGLLAAATVMVTLPLIYVACVAGVAAAVWWHATHDLWIVKTSMAAPRIGIVVAILYATPIIAGALMVLFMLAPLWPRRSFERKYYWVNEREQPLLYAYVNRLCDAMRAPRPSRINLVADGNAWVHSDNGWRGLVRRRLVLTIGLPLVAAMDLRTFTGVLAHEMGHFAQGGSMRLSLVVNSINAWLARLAWAPSPADAMIDDMVGGEGHWILVLIGGCAKLGIAVARLIFKGLAIVGHAVSRGLSRQAEFDADHQAARVVGGEAAAKGLEAVLYIDAAHTIAMFTAQQAWAGRQLPDDLVELSDRARRRLPEKTKTSIEASVLSQDASWFDTHPPIFKRMGRLKKGGLKGVLKLDAPATCLFKDFDELSKCVTIDAYQAVLGPKLQPEHLVPLAPLPAEPPVTASTARPARSPGGSPDARARTASRSIGSGTSSRPSAPARPPRT